MAIVAWLIFPTRQPEPTRGLGLSDAGPSLAHPTPERNHESLQEPGPPPIAAPAVLAVEPAKPAQAPDPRGHAAFAEKYRGFEPQDLAAARLTLERELGRIGHEIFAERFKNGDYETLIVEPGEPVTRPSKAFGWSENVRGTTTADGKQEMRIAGFSQAQDPRTSALFEEMVWLGEQLRLSGSLGLLEAVPAANSPQPK